MILYHGSYMEITNPDIYHSRDNLDFGKGFYTTTIMEQAQNWSKRFKGKKGKGVISIYTFDEVIIGKEASVKEFMGYTQDWLDYIVACRKGEYREKYDIIIGGVANDKVFDTIELFFDGLIDKYVAIERLKYEKPNTQICFSNQEIINKYLKYQKCEVV